MVTLLQFEPTPATQLCGVRFPSCRSRTDTLLALVFAETPQVTIMYYPCRGPEFSSQHPHQMVHNYLYWWESGDL